MSEVKVANIRTTTIKFGVGDPTLSMRPYLSTHHLWSADLFSQHLGEIENGFAGEEPSHIFNRHRAYALGAITCSAAFLEAAINEIYVDVVEGHSSYTHELTDEKKKTLSLIWELTEERERNVRVLDKYQLALQHLQLPKFELGSAPYQDANLVLRIRNALVHFKPETVALGEHSGLEKALAGKFADCRLYEGMSNPYFPDRCLGYGASTWALSSVRAFTDEFFLRVGLKPNYQRHSFRPTTS